MEITPHPHRMTDIEVRCLVQEIVRYCDHRRLFIDLFGGTGVVSIEATKQFREVIYCDWKLQKWKVRSILRDNGVEVFNTDYREMLDFVDSKTVVFADPPFFAMSDFNKWNTADHRILLNLLSNLECNVFMLNSTEFRLLIKNPIKHISWRFRQNDNELNNRVWLYIFNEVDR